MTPVYSLTSTERVLPRLALDFTAGALDARITFTRALGTATRVNSNGYIEAVAADTPRFDFDPVSKICVGLLIEDTRTNALRQSEGINSPLWTKVACSVSTDAVTSPANTLTGDTLTSSGSVSYIYQDLGANQAAGTYTLSCFVKAGNNNFVALNFQGDANYWATAVFDLSAVSMTQSAVGSGAGVSIPRTNIKDYGRSWYRIELTVTATGANLRYPSVMFCPAATGNTFTALFGEPSGNSAGKTFTPWGIQFETGAAASSYIPTIAAATVRNADVAVMTGTNFSSWWQATTGGAVVSARQNSVVGTSPWLQFDDETANNLIAFRGSDTNPELYIKATTDQAKIDAGMIAANTTYLLGGTWSTNNCAASLVAAAVVTDTSATIPTVTQARLGCDGTNYLNGWLQNIRYWPQRLLDAEVQAFSKP